MNGPPSIFSVMRLANAALGARLKSTTGLTLAEYEIICLIGENPGALRMRISEWTGVNITSVGAIAKKFRRRGWIVSDGKDVRYAPLYLTDDGVRARSDLRLKGLALEQEITSLIRGSLESLRLNLERISGIDNDAFNDITRKNCNGSHGGGEEDANKDGGLSIEKAGIDQGALQ